MNVKFEGYAGSYDIIVDGAVVGYISGRGEKWVEVIDPRDGKRKFFARFKYGAARVGNAKRFVKAILSRMTVAEYLDERAAFEQAWPPSREHSPLGIAERCGYRVNGSI